jgi:hypothetical protein
MKTTTTLVLIICALQSSFAQGKLDRAKDDLKDPAPKSAYSSDSEGGNDHDGGTTFLGGIMLDLFYFASYGALIGNVQPRSIASYPYADGVNGEYSFPEDVVVLKKSEFMVSNTLTLQSGTFGNDFKLNYRFLPFLGVEANHLHFFDRLDENSDLGISSILLNFYRIREKRVTGFWGLGATYVGSDVDKAGFVYNLGLDIYIANPVSVGILWKQSFINESSVNELRALVRYHMKKLAIHGGFIHYKIGEEGFPSAAIGIEYRL